VCSDPCSMRSGAIDAAASTRCKSIWRGSLNVWPCLTALMPPVWEMWFIYNVFFFLDGKELRLVRIQQRFSTILVACPSTSTCQCVNRCVWTHSRQTFATIFQPFFHHNIEIKLNFSKKKNFFRSNETKTMSTGGGWLRNIEHLGNTRAILTATRLLANNIKSSIILFASLVTYGYASTGCLSTMLSIKI